MTMTMLLLLLLKKVIAFRTYIDKTVFDATFIKRGSQFDDMF